MAFVEQRGATEQSIRDELGNTLPTASSYGQVPLVAGPDNYWTSRRLELLRWLELNAPVLAPVYIAAVQMAMDEAFPGRVWFVAHAIREIRNRLPDALAGETVASRTQYRQLAEEVYTCWIEDGLPADGSTPVVDAADPGASGPVRYEISQSLLLAVGGLVAGHLSAGSFPVRKNCPSPSITQGRPAPRWGRGTRLNCETPAKAASTEVQAGA